MKIKNVICERLFPEIDNRTYEKLLWMTSLGKSQANAYTKFVCKEYLKKRIPLKYIFPTGEYGQEDLKDLIERHYKLKQAGVVKDVSTYNSFNDMIKDLNRSQYITNSEKDKKARNGAKKIGEFGNWIIYNITSWDAAKKYGKGTTWCTTDSTSKKWFNSYTLKIVDAMGDYRCWLWYAIEPNTDSKYGISIERKLADPQYSATINVFNELDKKVGTYSYFTMTRNINDKVIDTMKKPLFKYIKELAFKKCKISNDDIVKAIKKHHIQESLKPEDKKCNRLLKNYVIRANKQLKDGIKLTDALRDEIVDYYRGQNRDISNQTKMDIIYRCPRHIAEKYIDIFKDKVKYNPKN